MCTLREIISNMRRYAKENPEALDMPIESFTGGEITGNIVWNNYEGCLELH